MDVVQYRERIVRPALKLLGFWSDDAEDLVLGTAVHESDGLRYIQQIHGPARGFCQMEPATHDDIWENFLKYHPDIKTRVLSIAGHSNPDPELLEYNLRYSAAMCRLAYVRFPDKIPSTLEAQADYWKAHYNTPMGRGTPLQYCWNWRKYVRQ